MKSSLMYHFVYDKGEKISSAMLELYKYELLPRYIYSWFTLIEKLDTSIILQIWLKSIVSKDFFVRHFLQKAAYTCTCLYLFWSLNMWNNDFFTNRQIFEQNNNVIIVILIKFVTDFLWKYVRLFNASLANLFQGSH